MPPRPSYKETLLKFRPPLIAERASDLPLPDPSPPLQFWDRHIPDNLTLKRVIKLPSIPKDISCTVDTYIDNLNSLQDDCFSFPRFHYNDHSETHAHKTLYVRNNGISNTCCRIVASIILHPKYPTMLAIFGWSQYQKLAQYGIINDAFVQHSVLHFRNFVDVPKLAELVQPFDEETREQLTILFKHSPCLAVAAFFCPSASGMLENMDRLLEHPFPWRLYSRCKLQPSAKKCPPDAPTTLWQLPPNMTGIRRSSRLSGKQSDAYHVPNPGSINLDESDATRAPLIEDFVQKAWSNAVHLDTTLISEDLAHGRLWLGLHITAIYDALERLPLLIQAKSNVARPLKRERVDSAIDHADTGVKKRARLKRKKEERTEKVFSSSTTIALFFQWDEYDSPAPLLLWPPGIDVRQKYGPKEYLRVVADGTLGSGGTGDVYSAQIYSSTKVACPPCVVKMASKPENIARLRQEHRVYVHLKEHGVTGIPILFGFYKNQKYGVSTLILANAGLPIALQMDAERRINLKEAEINEVRATLDCIHAAGVLHRDIRSWNILSSSCGHIFIADFDRASFKGTELEFQEEKRRLAQMTSGEFVDNLDMIGNPDSRSFLKT